MHPVTLALCLALALCCAWSLADTVLAETPLALDGFLGAGGGVLVAAATARWLPRRELGIITLLALSIVATLAMAMAVAGAAASSVSPISVVTTFATGQNPAVGHYLGLLLLCWSAGVWVGWCTLAEESAAAATAVPLIVLVADLVNVPDSLASAPFWPVVLSVLVALGLMAFTQAQRALFSWHRQMVVGGVVLLITAIAILLPPLSQANISGRFFHYSPYQPNAAHSRGRSTLSGFSDRVRPGGPLVEDEAPVLDFSTDPGNLPVYLQGAVMGGFQNGDWYEVSNGRRTLRPDQRLAYAGSAVAPASLSGAAHTTTIGLTVTYLRHRQQTINQLLYAGTPLSSPSDAVSYRLQGLYAQGQLVSVTQITPSKGLTSLLALSPQVSTYGTVVSAAPRLLQRAGTNYPAWVRPLAKLPESTPALERGELYRFAQRMERGASDPYQAAVNIANSLRQDELYSLAPPPAPAGTWPILYFLSRSHRGYCQYFASAMGAMLRAIGVPVRLVNGFLPGTGGSAQTPAVVTEADAHTWVQVFFPHYGWVTFDPTPGSTGPRLGVPPANAYVGRPAGSAPAYHAPSVRPPKPAVKSNTGGGSPLSLASVLLAAVLMLAAAALAWWRRRLRHPEQLRRRLSWLVRLGARGRPAAMTLGEMAAVCQGLFPEAAGGRALALQELVRRCDRLSFSAELPTDSQWSDRWSEVRPAFLWLAWRAWRTRGQLQQAPQWT